MKIRILYYVGLFLIIVITFFSGYVFCLNSSQSNNSLINNLNPKNIERPLEKYSIDNLRNANFVRGELTINQTYGENDKYLSHEFRYRFNPNPGEDYKKSTTGIINIPISQESRKFPLIILIRGYVDQNNYTSGDGSKNVGRYFASNGFITLAPDFLGYANSDKESGNIFESRFQTYTTILSLINSIKEGEIDQYWDRQNIFIWGHSNGGQIALTVLEITEEVYPTVLWAPVSKPFPYSVLYYTDESADNGKLIRKELSIFEALYDVEDYSLTNFMERINAPLQIHQGTDDDAVPYLWSKTFVSKLKKLSKEVDFLSHSGADHNLSPSWNEAALESLNFFLEYLK